MILKMHFIKKFWRKSLLFFVSIVVFSVFEDTFGVDVFYKKCTEKVHVKKGKEKSVIMDVLRKFAFCKKYFFLMYGHADSFKNIPLSCE